MNFQEGAFIYINKPYRMSSFGALAYVRTRLSKRLHVKRLKTGHAGTLDPLASGVLILCTGKATKRIEELQYATKEYTATLQLGATTASYDREHTVNMTYPTRHITRELIEQTLKQFVGEIQQIPPEYSACNIDGHRAYKMARRGEKVELKPKTLVIDEIDLIDCSLPDSITIRVVCSKGTYIRALARDIGEALQSGAHLTALCRTRVGNVTLNDCIALDDFPQWLASHTEVANG
jgi:tRNA pseudouridine55 synthase